MFATAAHVAMRRRTGAAGIEAVGGTRLEPEQPTHHRLPLVTVGPCPPAIFQVVDQPVSHLVGHHIDQEVHAVLGIQHRVEAQPPATEVRLAGALAAQVEPYSRPGQVGMHLATQLPGRLDSLTEDSRKVSRAEGGEGVGIGVRQRGTLHEC